MKRIVILLAAALLAAPVTAQNWVDALKKGATTVADKATGGKLTEAAICARWNYARPAVKLDSSNTAAALGGTALEPTIEEKLAPVFEKAGLHAGAFTFEFDNEGAFTAVVGTKSKTGTYTYDPSTHALTLTLDKGALGIGGGDFTGYAYLSGENLQLVFPADKLVQLVSSLGSKISSLASVTEMLKQYDKLSIGFAFSK